MDYQIAIKTLPDCKVIYRQGMIDSYEQCGKFISESIQDMRMSNPDLKCDDSYVYAEYLDPEYRESDIHIVFAWAVKEFGKETETIKFKQLMPVEAACLSMHGAYSENFPPAYAYLFKWIQSNGYRPAGAIREQYIDGAWNKTNPDDYLTEIQIPVVKI